MILSSLYELTQVVLYVFELSTQVFSGPQNMINILSFSLEGVAICYIAYSLKLGIYQVSTHEAFNELHHSSYLWQDKGFFRASSEIVPDYWFTNS